MIDAATQTLLAGIIGRQSRSLLQYVSEAFPWATPEEQDALRQLHEMIDEEQQAVGALLLFFRRHHLTPPLLGNYPMSFTTVNYVSLDHLLRLLVDYQQTALKELEKVVAHVSDGDARNLVQAMLDMKRRHLQSLHEMASHSPQPATV